MAKKTVLKVNMHCGKCKTQVLKAVTKLSGIDQVTADVEKGTLTVIGDVDPVCLVKKVRKTGKNVEITSVGPPKVEITSVGPPKKPNSPSKTTVVRNPLPPCGCDVLVPVGYIYPFHDYGICSIL